MKAILYAALLALLPLPAAADIGTGTFEDGGLRWARDHSPAELRILRLRKKPDDNDKHPDIEAHYKGACSWRVHIEVPSLYGTVSQRLSTLANNLAQDAKYNVYWENVMRFNFDRYADWGIQIKLTTVESKGSFGNLNNKQVWWHNDGFAFYHHPGSVYADAYRLMIPELEKALRDEEWVKWAYFTGDQSVTGGAFHSMKIGKTGQWGGPEEIWRHKINLKTCGGYWNEDYLWETRHDRVTKFDRVIHDAIDHKFKRSSACSGKGGWDATYLVMHSDDRIMVTHRCNGKREDGHFARGERKLGWLDSRFLINRIQAVLDAAN